MRKAAIAIMLLGWSALCHAAPDNMLSTFDYVPTQVPFTHILDYGGVLGSEEYVAALQQGPPYLITHHELTITHPYFGPMCDLGRIRAGEPEISGEEAAEKYRQNRERVEAYIAAAHDAGVKVVTSYICLMTTGGEPDRRLGLWRFWDNWDAFDEFNLPPEPADPLTWQQRKPDGSEHHFYTKDHPAYKPMFRYSNCVNNPDYQAWHRWVVEEAARAGLDGVFVDNGGSLRCYCDHCRAGFDEWLRDRYTPAEIAELFGGDTSMQANLSAGDLRLAETQLFWQESIHKHLQRIRGWGAAIRGNFYVYPNGLHGRAHYMATRFRDADLGMDENSSGDFGGHPGIARRHVVAGLYMRNVNQNMMSFRWAPAIGANCRVSMMSYSGYPKRDEPNLGPNVNVGVLGLAEAAAFGGGGTYLMYRPTGHTWMAPVREEMNAFFARNADLYADHYPWGQVAIFAPALPTYFGDRTVEETARVSLDVLSAHGLLVDLLTEGTISPEALARYQLVVVPRVRILSDAQMQALVGYTNAGGRLVIVGDDTATRDRLGRNRPDEARAQLLQAAAVVLPGTLTALEADGAIELPAPVRDQEAGDAGGAAGGAAGGDLLRFAAYVDDWARPRELTVHCVNYDVDIGTVNDRVGSHEDLRLRIPLPAGMRATAATLHAPGAEDVTLPISAAPGVAEVTLPRLDIYAFVALELEPAG